MSSGIQGLGEDRLAKDTAKSRKYGDVLNAMHEDFVKLDDGLEDLRVRTDAVEADMSDEDIADPTLTDEENAATGPIVSFDLGAFRREVEEGKRTISEWGAIFGSHERIRLWVESFVLEVGEWLEWEDSGCGKQTRSREVLLKNWAKIFRGQLRDKPPPSEPTEEGDLDRLHEARSHLMRIHQFKIGEDIDIEDLRIHARSGLVASNPPDIAVDGSKSIGCSYPDCPCSFETATETEEHERKVHS